MSKDKIVCNGKTYTGDDLLSGNCFIGNSIAGDELAIDTLTATICSPGESLTGLPYGTPVFYYHGEILVGKFYLDAVARSSKDNYDISCVSGVGLLDAVPHYGGLYQGETVGEVLEDIVGGVVPYTVSPGVGAVRVYGWLPVSTRRDNLRQLLFAVGASLKKDTAGEINIVLLSVEEPTEVSGDRLFSGGTVEYAAAVSEVVVVEHGYIITASDETATLYDDPVAGQDLISPKGEALNGVLVTFDGPVHDLAAEGGAVLESGVNYAILAPSGQTTLTGKKYTHTTREVHAGAANASGEKNVARVEDATLVNITNSEAVAKRVADYYSMSRTIKMGMVVGEERPGDAVALNDPFDDRATALLMSQDINMSNTLVAQTEMIAGYVPEHEGVYEHVAVLTGSGTWTVPAGVKKIHVVLIGKGKDGGDGTNGANGVSTSLWVLTSEAKAGFSRTTQPGRGGAGGKGGAGGSGGNIVQETVDVSPGGSFGFAAAASDDQDTVFGVLTSAAGTPSRTGYVDVFSGTTYGSAGSDGLDGGKGGRGGAAAGGGSESGDPAGEWPGGRPSGGLGSPGSTYEWHRGSYGGGGGAAGYIFSGEDPPYTGHTNGLHRAHGGTAVAAEPAKGYGSGGNGGHGGGGGGGGPGASIRFLKDYSPGFGDNYGAGTGGKGSTGTPGVPGCILVYY